MREDGHSKLKEGGGWGGGMGEERGGKKDVCEGDREGGDGRWDGGLRGERGERRGGEAKSGAGWRGID